MKKLMKFLVPLLLGALIVASCIWYLFVYDREFTRDTLLSQARYQDMYGNSRLSAWFYDAAYNFSGHDENVAIELANQYKHDGNYTKAEFTLTKAIHNNPTAELYTALCKAYVEQDKLLDAVNLLENLSHPQIKAQIDAQRPPAPTADSEPGYYSKYIDVHLASQDSKYIFYSTDGNFPSIDGGLYHNFVSLPDGETSLIAIAVNDDGLVSPLSVMSYTITGVIKDVTFTDPAMETAIRQAIGADADEVVKTSDLWQITEFTAPEGVTTFADLSLLTQLTKLTIHNQKIDTLSHLSGLSKLVILDLSGCSIAAEELCIPASLPGLSSLTLAGCSISTIEALEGARCLTYLDVSNNTIRNLQPLSSMTTLSELNLAHNAVTDQQLSSLAALENLASLNVSYNALTTLSPLSSCVKLSHLEADNNQLTTLSGVDKLPLLSHLSVDYNNLTDISLLAGSTELTNLSIASNDLTNITHLKSLTKLEILDFSGNNQVAELPAWPEGMPLKTIDGSYNALTSIDTLRHMQQLTHVYMDYNQLTNIDALSDCFCLVQINVYGNAIPDVQKLRDKDIIVNYDPTVKAEE